MLFALTRAVSRTLSSCELTFLEPEEIDLELAEKQHREYEVLLRSLGATLLSLAPDDDLPDGVFVEDAAIVLDEAAILTPMGTPARRPERKDIAHLLGYFREIVSIEPPAKLEGGDAMIIDRVIYIGESTRTDPLGIDALRKIVGNYGYEVKAVPVSSCLHFKTGCTYLGDGTCLVNPQWVDSRDLEDLKVIHVNEEEPWAANALAVEGEVLLAEAFPRTREILEKRGFAIRGLDISELSKAEAGLTCMSILFQG